MLKRIKNKSLSLALILLLIFVLIALFAPFIANDQAILCKDKSGIHFTLFDNTLEEACDFAIYPLIRYDHNNIDEANANFVSPFGPQNLKNGQQRHLLGTDQIGRDLAAGMVHSSRIALITGSLSSLIALIIGMLFGLFGAYYGNQGLIMQRKWFLSLIPLAILLLYFLRYHDMLLNSWKNAIAFFILCILLFSILFFIGGKIPFFRKKTSIPLDLMTSNFIEIFQSLPGSFLILILVSLFSKASIYNVILIIGLLRWPMIARYVRAEMLKIKEQRFIEASRAIGMKDWRIILLHAAPATFTPVIVAIAFGFSSAILLESALSFLGIGLPADHVSFGSMLNEARKNYEAWWLAVFPGLSIFTLVFLFNYLGDSLSKKIEKK